MTVRAIELRAGQSWLGPTAEAVTHLQDWIRSQPDGGGRGIRFALPDGHPALRCLATRLTGGSPGSYGLYVRAADPLGLVRAVAPSWRRAWRLRRRWAGREICTSTSTRAASTSVSTVAGSRRFEPWAPSPDESGPRADASMGDRGLPAPVPRQPQARRPRARDSADCIVDTDAGALLLDVLFPRMPASMWEFC